MIVASYRHNMLSDELVTFLESGISVLVGTRDARLFPECQRAIAARVEPGGTELTVFVPKAIGATTVDNLRDNGRVAVCFTRPRDHRSVQIKGEAVRVRDATARDRAIVDRYRDGLCDELAWVGLPPRLSRRIDYWPCHAVRVCVESVFDQTPGPGAGAPLTADPEAGSPAGTAP